MKHKANVFFLSVFLLTTGLISAQTKLPSILSDNMCMQQQTDAKIWGWDTPGQQIIVKPSWTKAQKTVTDKNGKWQLTILTPEAGLIAKITVNGSTQQQINNIAFGEVWLCSGQSNMERQLGLRAGQKPIVGFKEESEKADISKIRIFKVAKVYAETPQEDCEGQWLECSPETVLDFSAIGYFYGKSLFDKLSVPIGLIQSAWGGTPVEAWIERDDFDLKLAEKYNTLESCFELDSSYYNRAFENYNNGILTNEPLIPESVRYQRRKHWKISALYNGMISPLVNFNIRGAIWYQGESNVSNWREYKRLFPDMINSWRKSWDIGDFPFYFVQIAPYNYADKFGQPQIVEAQCEALELLNTGVAATQDIGAIYDIHPPVKKEVGRRLSLIALNKTYGWSDIVYLGPQLISTSTEDETFNLQFETPGSELHLSGYAIGSQWAFYIAGEDKVFYPARAVLNGDIIQLSSDEVKHPVAARYNWNNISNATIFNTHGLPALPFRTDTWDKVIYGR